MPKGLYEGRLMDPKVQRLTVPACGVCNNSWSSDETTFKNVLAVTTFTPVTEARFPGVMRSMTVGPYADEERERFKKLTHMIDTSEGKRLKIFPGGVVGDHDGPPADPRVLRVVRKIARGYQYEKGLRWPVADHEVDAFINPFEVPPRLLADIGYEHRDPAIVETWWDRTPEDTGYETVWMFKFYGLVQFLAFVKRA